MTPMTNVIVSPNIGGISFHESLSTDRLKPCLSAIAGVARRGEAGLGDRLRSLRFGGGREFFFAGGGGGGGGVFGPDPLRILSNCRADAAPPQATHHSDLKLASFGFFWYSFHASTITGVMSESLTAKGTPII